MLRLSWRLRFAAACSLLISAEGLHARCRSPFEVPPVYWGEFEFRLRLDEPATETSEPFCFLTADFVSPLLPGQFDAPARTISASDGDKRDTGFRGGVTSIQGSAGFPSELDGATIDVTRRSSALGAFVDSVFAYSKPAKKDPWSSWTVETVADWPESPPRVERSPLASPETWAPYSPDAWKFATPPEETAAAIAWLYGAKADEAPARRLVFDRPNRGQELMTSSALDRTEAPRPDDPMEAPAAGPVVATFVVAVRQSYRCRVMTYGMDEIVYRFPIPLAESEY